MESYEKRVNQINSMDDLNRQLRLAKQAVMQLRTQSKSARRTLEEKLKMSEKIKEGEAVLSQLRRSYFDIEDRVKASEVGK
jgi:predicted RNA-binding protein with EMAP domain